MNSLFKIGDLVFRVIAPQEIIPPENFMLFEQEGGEAAYTYTFELCGAFPQPQGRQAAGYPDLAVFEQGGLETRYLGVKGERGYYARYQEIDEKHAHVLIARSVSADFLAVDPLWLSMLAMERRLLPMGHMALHCAYMCYKGEAILFSAPSGTGKTTQATLWEKHRGSRVVNGDKALIARRDGRWIARGWPVCGSSGVCHNEDMPIRAIVMLSQGKTNTIERLTPFKAFSRIYSQITINSWNREAQQQAMALIEQLVTDTPVYHLSCTISEEAVECLEKALDTPSVSPLASQPSAFSFA